MGQKVNPHGLRVGVIKNWSSRWYESDEKFGDVLVSDYKLRQYLKKKLHSAGVPKIEIERDAQRVRIFIHCAKPGIIVGRGGAEIDKLRLEVEKLAGKPTSINIVEVRNPDMNAQLVAESIAHQLENRASFRRAMKFAIQRTMRMGAKGIKVNVSGRLNGAEIARSEHYHEGTIPLQTLRADIEYGFYEANTTYGKIGVKVWIYKGEVLPETKRRFAAPTVDAAPRQRDDRRPRRDDRGGNRNNRGGDNRGGRPGGDNRGGGNRPGGDNRSGGGRQGGNRPGGGNYGGNRQGGAPRPGGAPRSTPAAAPAVPVKEGGTE